MGAGGRTSSRLTVDVYMFMSSDGHICILGLRVREWPGLGPVISV